MSLITKSFQKQTTEDLQEFKQLQNQLEMVMFPDFVKQLDPEFYHGFIEMFTRFYVWKKQSINNNKFNENSVLSLLKTYLADKDDLHELFTISSNSQIESLLKTYSFYNWLYYNRGNSQVLNRFFELFKVNIEEIKFIILQKTNSEDSFKKEFISFEEVIETLQQDIINNNHLNRTLSEIEIYLTHLSVFSKEEVESFMEFKGIKISNFLLKFLPYHVLFNLIFLLEVEQFEINYSFTFNNKIKIIEKPISVHLVNYFETETEFNNEKSSLFGEIEEEIN